MSEVAWAERRLARKARRQAARRTELLEAARALLAKSGVEGFTMNAVAEAADVSKPSVYYYFDSKEALVGALASRLYEREIEVIERAIDDADSGLDALEALVRARMRLYLDDLDGFRILYVWTLAFSLEPERVAEQIYRESGRINDRLVERLEVDRDAGRIRKDQDLRRLANLAWITAHGLLLFHASLSATGSRSRFSLGELTDEACSSLLRSATAPERPTAAG